MNKQLFRDFLEKIKPGIDDKIAWEVTYALFLAYNPNNRAYHNMIHIYHCFNNFHKISRPLQDYFKLNLPELNQMEYALWYHDAVYDPGNNKNEEASALMAVKDGIKLGIPVLFLDNVGRFIMVTKHNREPIDIYEKYMIDIDLSILGSDRSSYRDYMEGIRKEYDIFPWDKYCEGRKIVLNKFLSKDKIYYTPLFQDEYEADARSNIKKELESLETCSVKGCHEIPFHKTTVAASGCTNTEVNLCDKHYEYLTKGSGTFSMGYSLK